MPLQAAMNMALGQLYTNHIQDSRLLHALVATARERFVPEVFAHTAYVDAPLMLSPTRMMLAPQTQAVMLREAQLSSTDNVLILPAGYGYMAAVAAQLASTVVALETEEALVKLAKIRLDEWSSRVQVRHVKQFAEGFVEHALYDAIIIEGVVQAVPESLIRQLKPEGRLVYAVPVSSASVGVHGRARLMAAQLGAGGLQCHAVAECTAPALSLVMGSPHEA